MWNICLNRVMFYACEITTEYPGIQPLSDMHQGKVLKILNNTNSVPTELITINQSTAELCCLRQLIIQLHYMLFLYFGPPFKMHKHYTVMFARNKSAKFQE